VKRDLHGAVVVDRVPPGVTMASSRLRRLAPCVVSTTSEFPGRPTAGVCGAYASGVLTIQCGDKIHDRPALTHGRCCFGELRAAAGCSVRADESYR